MMTPTISQTMTAEAQRIAIAEVCGYIRGTHSLGFEVWRKDGYFCRALTLPDYLNDLNAMHGAEKVLNREQENQFCVHLNYAVGNVDVEYFDVIHATAAQRAEAFLRTLGKWTDSPPSPPTPQAQGGESKP
jgi:hypothetical protein